MRDAGDAVAFGEKILSVLDRGSFTSTYKYAVLLGLLDLALEATRRDGAPPTSVTTAQLASRVIELYWPHVREFPALAREIAMQVAATDPQYLTEAEIPEDKKAAAMEIFQKEVEGKPEEMKAKILEGKMSSYFSGSVLLSQSYIKDESKTVKDLLNEAAQKFGERVEVTRFARFSAR